jgi:hypothetical protein
MVPSHERASDRERGLAGPAVKRAVRGWVVVIVVALVGLAGWIALTNGDPELVIGDTVAADFAALAEAAHARFVAAAPAAAGCMGSLRLEAAAQLDDLARYDQSTGIVYVRVPATASSLEASLVHEFAHHLEVVCESHRSLRPRFLIAQGRPVDTAWFGDVAWEERPSEQFAEAVVQVVLGSRSRHQLGLRLNPESIGLVEAWLTTSD